VHHVDGVIALSTNRRLLALALFVFLTAGCSGSRDTAATETSTSTASETTPAPRFDKPPRTYRELMARLPPFDVPASREVAAWRKATIEGFLGRCTAGGNGADRASFVAANEKVLSDVALFPGAVFLNQYSVDRKDGNGCPDGSGPATYYVTYRSYRLPPGTKPGAVFRHYQREFFGWLESASTPCERTYGQGPAYAVVSACKGVLRLSIRARAPVEIPEAAMSPPRPFGVQYPFVRNDLATPKPTAYETDPGETCERVAGTDVPAIINPPPPGVRAEIRGDEVVVEWSLGTVRGDCPPSDLVLSYPAVNAYTIREPVHRASGVTRMPLLDFAPRPTKLTAIAVSVDGVESRPVSVLIRK